MKVLREIGITEIEEIVKKISEISAVQVEPNRLVAKLKDSDRDLVLTIVNEADKKRLICNIPLQVPADKYVDSLLVTNTWNRIADSHDTYAYVTEVAERLFIRLESYCVLAGSIDGKGLVAWILNLIDHIYSFERLTISRL